MREPLAVAFAKREYPKEEARKGNLPFALPVCQWPRASLCSQTPFAVLIAVYPCMSKWLAATFCSQSELESERKLLVKGSRRTAGLKNL